MKSARLFFIGIFFVAAFFLPVAVHAQTDPTPTTAATLQLASTPGEPNWQIDAEVTQVGRNAERARQFIFWVVKHPPIFNVPQIAQAWAFSRNVAYVLIIFVLIGLALQLVISARGIGPTFSGISLGTERINITTIIIRVVLIFAFVTFSYITVLLLIQMTENVSRFFIERLGGEDLFNILYSGNNQEANYNFVGYKNTDPLEQDMVTTSLLLVRLSSFTYNFMGVILIARHIVLIFLLIASPFLALLLPFIFIRNTGYIWIGEFFRWLFYGPLVSLFLAALARIWKSGIPYQFDFSRAKTGTMVYQTGINILYGGPAQTLSPTNTSNYVDTYAEYVIGIIMLWVAIFLPWLLLRIFRDYCCDLLEKNSALLSQILDKMRSFTPPPAPAVTPSPTTTFGRNIDLPYRTVISEKKSESITREKIIEKMRERDMSAIDTREIQRAFNLQVKSLKDVAHFDTRHESASQLRQLLNQIQNPLSTANPADRQAFEVLRTELTRRAAAGDQDARSLIQAATSNVSEVPQLTQSIPQQALRDAVNKPGVPVVLPGIRLASVPITAPSTISGISQKTQLSEQKVQDVLKSIPLAGTGSYDEKVATIAKKTGIDTKEVQQVLDNMPKETAVQNAPVSIEEYSEVRQMWMSHYRSSEIPLSGTIKSRLDWIQEDIKTLTNTLNLLTSPAVKDRQQGMENVASLLPFLLLGGFTDVETLSYIKAKLEAARLTLDEMEHINQAKEEVRKEQEELVSIPVIEKQEEKEMTLSEQQAMPIPEEQEKKEEMVLPEFSDEPEEQQKVEEKTDDTVL